MGEIPMIPTNDTSSMEESKPALANSSIQDLKLTELTRIPEDRASKEDTETACVSTKPGKLTTNNTTDHRLSDVPLIPTKETNGDSANSSHPVKNDRDKVYQQTNSSVLETEKTLKSPVIFDQSVTVSNSKSAERKTRVKTSFSDTDSSTVAKVELGNNKLPVTSLTGSSVVNSKLSDIQNSKEKTSEIVKSPQNDTVEKNKKLTLTVNNTERRSANVQNSVTNNTEIVSRSGLNTGERILREKPVLTAENGEKDERFLIKLKLKPNSIGYELQNSVAVPKSSTSRHSESSCCDYQSGNAEKYHDVNMSQVSLPTVNLHRLNPRNFKQPTDLAKIGISLESANVIRKQLQRYEKNKRRRYLRKIGYYKRSHRVKKVKKSSAYNNADGREKNKEGGAANNSVLGKGNLLKLYN